MIKEAEEREVVTVRKKGENIQGYKSHDKNTFLVDEDIIGLDANVLVDMVESQEFKEEVRANVELGVLKIYTTNIALGEARHVLVKKRDYQFDKATDALSNILKEFNIQTIKHQPESNALAEQWVNVVKNRMYLKKFGTFVNDCKILSNLYHLAKVNLYITEDTDLEKAVKILKLPLIVKIIGEASNLSGQKIREFFKENRKAYRKK